MSKKSRRNALPEGYELHWYRIEKVLGQGGFGLTYLARDINLDRLVAIKEYMPALISIRDEDLCIHAVTEEDEADYEWGLQRFISEARTLTRFEHPNLVRVINVFEANQSAYMVMSYEVGTSLKELLKSGRTFSEEALIRLLFPLMDGLEAVHQEGFVHRDIKPGNIFIREDGRPVLLDFGSARQTRGTPETMTLTNFVSPGYAPIEQYASKSDRQGPWTDIYGLAATAYEVITGKMPEAAIDRSVTISNDAGDNLVQTSELGKDRYSGKLLAAIDHALAFNIHDRPQSIAEWRLEFGYDRSQLETIKIPGAKAMPDLSEAPTEKIPSPPQSRNRQTDVAPDTTDEITIATEVLTRSEPASAGQGRMLKILAAAAVILVLGGTGLYLYQLPVMTPPAPETAQEEHGGTDEPIAATEAVAPLEPEEPKEPTVEEKIEELLALAREDIEALRLTTPAENNAYDKYQSILALDHDNTRALRGIDMVSEKYLQLMYADIEAKNFTRAEHYIQKAEQVTPDLPKVKIARKALQMAVEEYEESQTFFGRLKRVFE